MDITMGNRSESSGRFNFVRGADGDVSFDDTETHAVMTSVIEQKRGYWANREHGTGLRQVKSLTRRTPSQVEAEALQGMESVREIRDDKANAIVERSNVGRLKLRLSWTAGGIPQSATVEG